MTLRNVAPGLSGLPKRSNTKSLWSSPVASVLGRWEGRGVGVRTCTRENEWIDLGDDRIYSTSIW